jgi:hypothetical protein
MPSIIFYDYHGHHHHPPSDDPHVLFLNNLQCLHDLREAVLNSNHARPIVCLCCPDPSAIINKLQENVLIYLCRFHSGGVNLGNVRENVVFSANSDWKFKIVLNRIRLIGINRNREQLLFDLQLLREIVVQDAIEPQLPVENQSSSSETSGEDLEGEEAEENEDQI